MTLLPTTNLSCLLALLCCVFISQHNVITLAHASGSSSRRYVGLILRKCQTSCRTEQSYPSCLGIKSHAKAAATPLWAHHNRMGQHIWRAMRQTWEVYQQVARCDVRDWSAAPIARVVFPTTGGPQRRRMRGPACRSPLAPRLPERRHHHHHQSRDGPKVCVHGSLRQPRTRSQLGDQISPKNSCHPATEKAQHRLVSSQTRHQDG